MSKFFHSFLLGDSVTANIEQDTIIGNIVLLGFFLGWYHLPFLKISTTQTEQLMDLTINIGAEF